MKQTIISRNKASNNDSTSFFNLLKISNQEHTQPMFPAIIFLFKNQLSKYSSLSSQSKNNSPVITSEKYTQKNLSDNYYNHSMNQMIHSFENKQHEVAKLYTNPITTTIFNSVNLNKDNTPYTHNKKAKKNNYREVQIDSHFYEFCENSSPSKHKDLLSKYRESEYNYSSKIVFKIFVFSIKNS